MNKIRLNKKEKEILRKLQADTYVSPVPTDDVKYFEKLESLGLVSHLSLDQQVSELYGPELTEGGTNYLKFNPKLKNPGLDWKWIVGIVTTLFTAIAIPLIVK